MLHGINNNIKNNLLKVMKHYSPTGRRNHGRLLKSFLGTWDRNGSTSDPTPWKIYDDDDDDDYDGCDYKGVRTSRMQRITVCKECAKISTAEKLEDIGKICRRKGCTYVPDCVASHLRTK